MQSKSIYQIELKIKNENFVDDLINVRVVSSLNTAYQIVTLSILYETSSVILDDLLGKYPLNLSIKLISQEESTILETIDMELQYVDSNYSVQEGRPQLDSQAYIPDRTIIDIVTICRKPFKTMSQIVNDVYEGKTCKQILQELAGKTGAEVIYDFDKENTEVIEQVVIPPTTFYNTIRYLDDYYGLFKGVSNLGFCQYDNKLYIQNLTTRMNKNQTFTVTKLASDADNTNETIDQASDENWFITVGQIQTSYSGSAQFTNAGKNIKHIVHPDNKLYDVIEQNLEDVCSEYGANAKPMEVNLDPNINEREVYVINHSGDNDSDVYANVQAARQIIGMSEVRVGIRDSIYLLHLVNVGEPVKLKTTTEGEQNLSGKYLLKSSDIVFDRSRNNVWSAATIITLMRTNKYV